MKTQSRIMKSIAQEPVPITVIEPGDILQMICKNAQSTINYDGEEVYGIRRKGAKIVSVCTRRTLALETERLLAELDTIIDARV